MECLNVCPLRSVISNSSKESGFLLYVAFSEIEKTV